MPIQGISLAGCWHLVQYIQQQCACVMLAHYQTPPLYLLTGYSSIEAGAWLALWKPAWHFPLTQLQLQCFIWVMLQNGVLFQFLVMFLLSKFQEKGRVFPLVLTWFSGTGHIQLLCYDVSDFKGLKPLLMTRGDTGPPNLTQSLAALYHLN